MVLSSIDKCGDNLFKGTKEELNDKFSFIVKWRLRYIPAIWAFENVPLNVK